MKILFKSTFLVLTLMTIYIESFSQLQCGTYDNFDLKFQNVGKLHNAVLTNVYNNFSSPKDITDKETAINYIKDFNKSFYLSNEAQYMGISQPLLITNNSFDISKYYVDDTRFSDDLLSQNSGISFDKCLDIMDTSSSIDNNNKILLRNISDLIKQKQRNSITNSSFENSLVGLTNNWLSINDGNSFAKGSDLTGYILTIGLKSCEWWRENPNAMISDVVEKQQDNGKGPNSISYKLENSNVSMVIFNDIAGALVGSVLSIGNQLVYGGGINWTQVGTGAVTGAVMGSTGIVGKIGKWLKSLF